MKILALIPARGGSKRLPGKNIKPLGGIPLIGWTIKTAIKSKSFVDILVSTDSKEIADVSASFGALVPWLRPPELATDTASSIAVIIHALDAYESAHTPVDGLMLLQPTSPFRSVATIKKGITLFKNSYGTRPIVSLSPAPSHPAWCFKKTEKGMEPFLGWDEIKNRSQDLESAWTLNGVLYLNSTTRIRNDLTLLSSDSIPLIMLDTVESVDIDTPFDFQYCEGIISNSCKMKIQK